ncbi:MAG: hypothetical protein JWN46_3484 [Acidimicrobiales bacterium]|nr:hypothetical protein [Acidimicrobiales bacterium]
MLPLPTAPGLAVGRSTNGSWIVDIDARTLRFNLMPGRVEPKGTFIRPAAITPFLAPTAVAAFNGGFKFSGSQGGFFLGGVAAVPLVDGAASLVIRNDGTATVGLWGRDVTMGPNVEAVLQNLHLMIDRGAPTDVSDTDRHVWGSTINNESRPDVARSGICVTATGRVRWVGHPRIGVASLAAAMVEAHCLQGMELDINPMWVSFAIYDHPDPANGAVLKGHNLYDGMHFAPETYLLGKDRNWILLTSR